MFSVLIKISGSRGALTIAVIGKLAAKAHFVRTADIRPLGILHNT